MAGRGPWALLARAVLDVLGGPSPASPPPPPVRWSASGYPECGWCGLRFTTPRAMDFHRAPDGSCLDPMTARRRRGGPVVSMVFDDDDGTPVWGWPREVLDARPPADGDE